MHLFSTQLITIWRVVWLQDRWRWKQQYFENTFIAINHRIMSRECFDEFCQISVLVDFYLNGDSKEHMFVAKSVCKDEKQEEHESDMLRLDKRLMIKSNYR